MTMVTISHPFNLINNDCSRRYLGKFNRETPSLLMVFSSTYSKNI